MRESARPGSLRGCRCACKRAHALRVCTAERRPRVGGGSGGPPGVVWQPPGESRAGSVGASPGRCGLGGRARARRLCASRVQVSEQETCLHCCLRCCPRWGRLQKEGVSTRAAAAAAAAGRIQPWPCSPQAAAPGSAAVFPGTHRPQEQGAGVGIWCRNRHPACLVTPGHRFWCCPGPAPQAVSPSPATVAGGGRAGPAARLPHLCVQVPAELRRARTCRPGRALRLRGCASRAGCCRVPLALPRAGRLRGQAEEINGSLS